MTILEFDYRKETVGVLTLLSVHTDGTPYAGITVNGAKRGELVLGEKKLALKDGKAELNLDEIEDGYVTPRFVTDGSVVCGTPLIKEGCEILTAENALKTKAAYIEEIRRLKKELDSSYAEIARLERSVGTGRTFTLE